MAAFNPQLNQQQQNFVGYSRGSEPDLSMGTAMKGLGNLIDQGAQALDENVQANIREDVYEGFDATNDAFGIDTQAMLSDQAVGVPRVPALPSEVEEGKTFLQRLTNARDAGTLKESHYWGKLETMVKSLRQRYPGYREQIDNIVADVTGTTPANALRNSLLDEINQENRAREQGKVNVENFVNQNAQYIPEALLIRHQNGEDVYQEIQLEVASRKRNEQSYADAKMEMDHLEQEGKLQSGRASEELKREINTMVNTSISDASYVAGANYEELVQKAKEAASDHIISGPEDEMIRSNLRNLEQAWLTQTEKMISSPWQEGSSNSYASKLSKAELDEARDLVKSRIAILQNMMLHQETGILASTNAHIAATKSEATARLLDSDSYWQMVAGVSGIGGSEVFNNILLSNGGLDLLAQGVLAAQAFITGKTALGENGSLSKGVEELQRMKVDDPNAYRLYMENSVNLLLEPKTPLEMVQNISNEMFSPANRDFVLKFDGESQIRVFANMASPQVTQRMDELRKAGHTDLWENYVKWTTDNFSVIFGQKGQTLQEAFDYANANGANVSIVYDADSGQFEPDFDSAIDPNAPFPEMQMQIQQAQQFELDTGIKELNTYLKFLDPILEITGEDREAVVEQMMRSIGIEFEQEDENEDLGTQGTLEETGMEGIQLASYQEMQESVSDLGYASETTLEEAATGTATGALEEFVNEKTPIDVANKFVGLNEREHKSVISSFIKKAAGININPATTAWCAAFVNAVLGSKGVDGTGRLNARSFLAYGTPVDKPSKGDIVVLSRGGKNSWKGHVGFYMGEEDGKIKVLGGNQSNSVSEAFYPAEKVLGYRRPPKISGEVATASLE